MEQQAAFGAQCHSSCGFFPRLDHPFEPTYSLDRPNTVLGLPTDSDPIVPLYDSEGWRYSQLLSKEIRS